tara:strand:- start:4258 stop:5253 length:996 start_codon:yes stop_codon:yes gene_type:complete
MKTLKHIITIVALSLGAVSANAAGFHHAADPKKVVGVEGDGSGNCVSCHGPAVSTWKKTHHFKTFEELEERETTIALQEKLDIFLITEDENCTQCHYTMKNIDDELTAISGISCESCHGGAKEWNPVHQKIKDNEDPMALVKAEKLGMIRPKNYYDVAANCYSCHTVPNEEIVNKGHKAGSEFELVAWSQGEVRHNFRASQGKENAEAPIERRRMFYVVGQCLDLEYSIRAVGKATAPGKYLDAMKNRVAGAQARLQAIQKLSAIDEVGKILAAANGLNLAPGQAAALNAAADKISALAKGLSQSRDGTGLAAIDSLLPKAGAYRGAVLNP